MTKIIKKLRKDYYIILAGDGNAKLGDIVGDTKNRKNAAGRRFLRMMEDTGITNLQPSGQGPHWTHYNVAKEKLRDRKTFDPAEATSIIDLVSAHADTISDNIIKDITLQNDTHLSTDHVGLQVQIRATETDKEMLKPIRGKQALRTMTLTAGTKEQLQYTRETRNIIKHWNSETEEDKLDWSSEEALEAIQTLIRRLTKNKNDIAGTTVPQQHRSRDKETRGNKRKNLHKAFTEAHEGINQQPKRRKRNRCLWERYKTLETQKMEEEANKQQDREEREATKTENAWKQNRERDKWAQRARTFPKKGPQALQKTFFDEDGNHVHESIKVKRYINAQVHSMANPGILKATTPEHKLFEEETLQQVEWIAGKSAMTQDWTPEEQDVDTIIDYLTEAHRARTCAGIDQITPDTFIFGHKGIRQAIMRILNIIARTAKTPTAWGRLRIVLALKPGRNPQDIKKGYRPIGVGSLLLKAIERVIKRQFDMALEKKPLHKSILAYQKTIGHEMAVFAIKGTILHEKYKDPKAKIVGIGIDIEHAFNGTWKELVLRQAKDEHEIQDTI
jgi:hypothetical protein